MDILFIDTFQKLDSYQYSLGINILSTIVNTKSDYTSEVISFSNLLLDKKMPTSILFEKNYETIVNYILNKNPKIISFYTLENSYFISLIVAKNIKEKNSDIKIILAGPQASLCSSETLKTFDFIDFIAIGEGEKNIISIIDYFNNKEEVKNIKGVCYRESDKIFYTEPSPLVENLNELPILQLNENALPTKLNIETGRGCPYNCTFCSTKTFWKRKVRLKSIDRLINEIQYYMTRYNINHFRFTHDLFTVSKKHILGFCNRVINSGIKIEWTCSARADNLDEEMVSLMKKAGCKKIFFGIETGSQLMQEEINKNLNMSKVKDTIKLVDRYGIEMKISFIYGFPEEKEKDLLQTLDLIRFCVEDMLIPKVLLSKCMCFPGTYIYNTNKSNLIFNNDNFILFNYPAKSQLHFIKEHPNLFSSLFMINNELLNKYFYLDICINYIYGFLFNTTPKTLKEIITYYNNNILDFYVEYSTAIKEVVTLLTKKIYFDDNLSFSKIIFDSVEDFSKNKIQDEFIMQLLKFEISMLRISQQNKNNKEPKVLTFDYDMLTYYEHLIKKKEKCKLAFDVTEYGEIKISKVM